MTTSALFAPRSRSIIGMVHLRALPGAAGAAAPEAILRDARSDAATLAAGGVDAIMVENNYDLPHRETILPETLAMFAVAAAEIRRAVTVPLGICALWNDYRASFAIARAVGAAFIRIPVLVDTVRTAYGTFRGLPEQVQEVRRELRADSIAVMADIHVKHAELLSTMTLAESAKAAAAAGADGLIVTGGWTGDPPRIEDLQTAAQAGLPVFVGSGATPANVGALLGEADGIIVGTALKEGRAHAPEEEVNLKSADQRIELARVQAFMAAVRGHAPAGEGCRGW